jgi:hypothetical protein
MIITILLIAILVVLILIYARLYHIEVWFAQIDTTLDRIQDRLYEGPKGEDDEP